jgi:hypothetical protein
MVTTYTACFNNKEHAFYTQLCVLVSYLWNKLFLYTVLTDFTISVQPHPYTKIKIHKLKVHDTTYFGLTGHRQVYKIAN